MARKDTPKTQPGSETLEDLLQALPEARRDDARLLARLMQQVTGEPAVVWGGGIVGFGRYAQHYADGRRAPWPLLGFSARGREISVYLMGGLDRHRPLVEQLGRCRTGKSCLYLKRVAEVPETALRALLEAAAADLAPWRIRG